MTTNPNNPLLNFMRNRRSVLAKNMAEPGPNEAQLNTILTIGARVPDHRKLEPWRFIVLQGEARKAWGEMLTTIKAEQEELMPEQIAAEQSCFMRAPVVIAVVASPVEHRTPEIEQILSAGAVCQNINIAAGAMGFASQWITGWSCLNEAAQQAMGLTEKEFIAGYLHIGSSNDKPADRQRPDLATKVSYFSAT